MFLKMESLTKFNFRVERRGLGPGGYNLGFEF